MLKLSTLALAALLLSACGGDDEPSPSNDDSSEEPADDSSEEPTDGEGGESGTPGGGGSDAGPPPDPSTYGAISGTVSFLGEPPALRSFNLQGLAGCDHHHPDGLLTEDYLIQNGKIEGVFVYIKRGLHADLEWPVPTKAATFDQVGCVFIPHTLGVRAGQTISVNSSDEVGHNVNGHTRRNNNFNFTMPAFEKGREISFKRAEVPISITCDIHPHMSAYIAVFDDPFFARTGSDGRFSLDGVPPGDYTLRAWHEKFGTLEAQVVLEPNGALTTNFSFKQ